MLEPSKRPAGMASAALRRLPGLLRYSLRLTREAAPGLSAASAGLQLSSGVALGVQVLLARRLLLHFVGTGHNSSLAGMYGLIIVLTVVTVLASLAVVVRAELQPLLSERVTRHSLQQVVRIASTVELRDVEDADYHDSLQRALMNAGTRSLQLTNGLSAVTGALISTIAVAVALLVIQPLLFAAALLAAVPLFVTTIRASRAFYEFNFNQTLTDRQRTYIQTVLTQRQWAKDIRAYDLSEFLWGRYQRAYQQRIDALAGVVRKRVWRAAYGSVAAGLLGGGALALVVLLIERHDLPLASAGAAAAALVLISGQLRTLAAGAAALYESSLYMFDFASFVSDQPSERPAIAATAEPAAEGVPVPRPVGEIVVDQVDFRYPSSPALVLDSVTMRLPAGSVVALVGENGSGKTTLAKLLAGLYEPTAGSISWDGVDARRFARSDLRSNVAVLFQDFAQFAATAAENIGWGRWERRDDSDAVAAAADRAGATEFVAKLPQGLATQIGPEFLHGIELSGGQWQRIALARAEFREAQLVILDEPTAALDPRAEAALYASLRSVFKGKTVIMVSHRMATVRSADYIYVLGQGRVIEEGTHRALLEAGGTYASMFKLQRAAFGR